MIFKFKKHKPDLYNTLLKLSRNLFFYNKLGLNDTFQTRIYLMFIHYSIILITQKNKKIEFEQNYYDSLFKNIENNLRELGYGDVAVNKKMKDLNKIFYDILLKIENHKKDFEINHKLIFTYFNEFDDLKDPKYDLFNKYFIKFYHFCFELSPKSMIKDALLFKD